MLNDHLVNELANEMTRNMEQIGVTYEVPVRKILELIIHGDLSKGKDLFILYIQKVIVQQVNTEKDALVQLLIVGMIGCVMIIVSEMFRYGQISNMVSLIVYCVLANCSLRIVKTGQAICVSFSDSIRQYMQMLLPTYCVCVNVSSAGMSGVSTFILYQGLLYGMELLIINVFIPLTYFYIVISVIGGIGKTNRFAKLKSLIERVINYTSKISVYVGIGGFTIQEFCQANTLKGGKAILAKGMRMIPGIGQVSEQVTQMFLTSGSFLRNVVGILGVICLGAVVLYPMLRLIILGGSMKLIAAILAIAGGNRLATLVDGMGQSVLFYMRFVMCQVSVLCMSFLVVATCLGG